MLHFISIYNNNNKVDNDDEEVDMFDNSDIDFLGPIANVFNEANDDDLLLLIRSLPDLQLYGLLIVVDDVSCFSGAFFVVSSLSFEPAAISLIFFLRLSRSPRGNLYSITSIPDVESSFKFSLFTKLSKQSKLVHSA